jgi:hypothetical protein
VRAKYSERIERRACQNALHAERCARSRGKLFNTYVCINFSDLSVPEENVAGKFKAIRARITRWWRYQRNKGRPELGEILGVYSHANPDNIRHVDWVLHVPVSLKKEFDEALRKVMRRVLSTNELGLEPHIKPISNAPGLMKYILKGIDPQYAAHFHIRHQNEGFVSGRRTGVSRAASYAARKASGWTRRAKNSETKEVLKHAKG